MVEFKLECPTCHQRTTLKCMEDDLPQAGHYSICLGCAAICCFTETMQLKMLTDEDREQVRVKDSRTYDALAHAQMTIAARLLQAKKENIQNPEKN